MVLILEVLLCAWKLASDIFKFDFDEAVISRCIDEWHFKDNSVTYLLTCFMISMPIQQFTSCFYVIPKEHGFFNHDHNLGSKSLESKDDIEDNETTEGFSDDEQGKLQHISEEDESDTPEESDEGERDSRVISRIEAKINESLIEHLPSPNLETLDLRYEIN